MVIEEGVTAGGSHSVELVVGKALAEVPAGGSQGIQEAIAGIVHAVGIEDGFEAAFVEAGTSKEQLTVLHFHHFCQLEEIVIGPDVQLTGIVKERKHIFFYLGYICGRKPFFE